MVVYKVFSDAEVVELVDTQDSGSCAGNRVLVRVQSSAPQKIEGVSQPANPFCFVPNLPTMAVQIKERDYRQ